MHQARRIAITDLGLQLYCHKAFGQSTYRFSLGCVHDRLEHMVKAIKCRQGAHETLTD